MTCSSALKMATSVGCTYESNPDTVKLRDAVAVKLHSPHSRFQAKHNHSFFWTERKKDFIFFQFY
jgi:hypothetical protein